MAGFYAISGEISRSCHIAPHVSNCKLTIHLQRGKVCFLAPRLKTCGDQTDVTKMLLPLVLVSESGQHGRNLRHPWLGVVFRMLCELEFKVFITSHIFKRKFACVALCHSLREATKKLRLSLVPVSAVTGYGGLGRVRSTTVAADILMPENRCGMAKYFT